MPGKDEQGPGPHRKLEVGEGGRRGRGDQPELAAPVLRGRRHVAHRIVDGGPDGELIMGTDGTAALLEAERDLQAAMRAGDVAALERLLHPDLLAVGPDGRLYDREADLSAHRSGVFAIHDLREEELEVRVLGDLGVTFVVLRIEGSIAGEDASGRIRYTRTWSRDGGAWRVVAAHIAPVTGP